MKTVIRTVTENSEPGKVVVASLNNNNKKKTAMFDQKSPFIFNNYPLLRLLKLITASPLINSYPMQTQKKHRVATFFLMFFSAALICMCIFTLCGFTWLLAWKYVTICNISSLKKRIYLARGAYTLMFALGEWQFSPQFSLHNSPKKTQAPKIHQTKKR